MTEVKARLSSTELFNLLKSSEIEKFRSIVSKYFSQNKTDHVSGLKLSKTIAAFAGDEKSQNDKFVGILEDFKLSIETVVQHTPSSQLTDSLLKELYDNSYYVLTRLVKLKQIQAVKSFWRELCRLSTKFQDSRSIHGRAYNLYATLWKFSLESSASSPSVSERIGLIDIAQGALEFFLVIEKTEKFSPEKFVEKVSRVSKTFAQKEASKEVLEKISSLIINLSRKMSDKSKREEFGLLLFQSFYQIAPGSLGQCLPQVRQLAGDEKLVAVLEIFTNLQAGRVAGTVLPGQTELSPGALAVLLPIFSKFVSSVSSSRCTSSPEFIIEVSEAVMACLHQARARPALISILERLGYLLFFLVKNNEEVAGQERTQRAAIRLFKYHLETLHSQEEAETSRWTNLYVNSYNTAAKYYNRKLYQPCDDLLTITVQTGLKLLRSDPSQDESLTARLKLQGDTKFRLKEYKAALKCVAYNACVVILRADNVDEAARRLLSDLGDVWLSYKSSWLLSGKEKLETEVEVEVETEVHRANILRLLEEENSQVELGSQERWVLVLV